MSIQFGKWNFDGQSVDPEYIARVEKLIAPYAPDSTGVCRKASFVMLHGAFHVTPDSRNERQPFASPEGTFLTWDGRLDNRSELFERSKPRAGPNSSDLTIVTSLYGAMGVETFGYLVGDWALSVLNHYEQTLVLAKDFLGTRPLFYTWNDRSIVWSSVLEPLILLSEKPLTISEEYVAGWLSGSALAHLTPYNEILAVPPASFVKITRQNMSVHKYWDFDPGLHTRHESDGAYEEQFRVLFSEAIRRRLRSNSPVLAELSGGVDSSSIVCVSDQVLAAWGNGPRLDTLSYFNDTEPHWNERPFFTAVEKQRGRAGLHIDVENRESFFSERDPERFASTPAEGGSSSPAQRRVADYLGSQGIRVVLSGIGGDECTGGVPTGIPELSDLLVRGRVRIFGQRALLWALAARQPLIHLCRDVFREFLPVWSTGFAAGALQIPWLNRNFEHHNRKAFSAPRSRLKPLGPLPSFQENLFTLEYLRRQIAAIPLAVAPAYERRYPFLDRDLLSFLFSIPREQIVRPTQRRSLLRRALLGIVPDVVLSRKRKGYVVRGPLKGLHAEADALTEWTRNMISSSLGLIEPEPFQRGLTETLLGNERYLLPLIRTLTLEWWLRDPRVQAAVDFSCPLQRSASSPIGRAFCGPAESSSSQTG